MLFRQITICSFCINAIFIDALAAEEKLLHSDNKYKSYVVFEDKSKNSVPDSYTNKTASNSIFHSLDFSADLFNTKNKRKQNGHLHALIPLAYDNSKHSQLFFIPGIAFNKSQQTYNAGLGFRHLNNTKDLLLGFNTFYDYDAKYGNKRLSGGLELEVQNVSLSGNIYHGLNKWRISKHDKSLQRKASNGHDVKLKVQMPFYPQVGLSVRYFHWKGKQVDLYGDKHYAESPHGFTYGAEYKPISMLGVAVQHTFKRHYKNTRVMLNISYDFNRSLQSQSQIYSHPHVKPLSLKSFSHPERESHIVLKTSTVKVKKAVNFTIPVPSVFSSIASPMNSSKKDLRPILYTANSLDDSSRPILSPPNYSENSSEGSTVNYTANFFDDSPIDPTVSFSIPAQRDSSIPYPIPSTVAYSSENSLVPSENSAVLSEPSNSIIQPQESSNITHSHTSSESSFVTPSVSFTPNNSVNSDANKPAFSKQGNTYTASTSIVSSSYANSDSDSENGSVSSGDYERIDSVDLPDEEDAVINKNDEDK